MAELEEVRGADAVEMWMRGPWDMLRSLGSTEG